MKKSLSQLQFEEKSLKGTIHKQGLTQHEAIVEIMNNGYKQHKKIWWFAYELMGFHKINGKDYFMSYKGSTRVSELSGRGVVESRQTIGKLHLYALVTLA